MSVFPCLFLLTLTFSSKRACAELSAMLNGGYRFVQEGSEVSTLLGRMPSVVSFLLVNQQVFFE
jgi:F0F1-type ATP synthase beta subunit